MESSILSVSSATTTAVMAAVILMAMLDLTMLISRPLTSQPKVSLVTGTTPYIYSLHADCFNELFETHNRMGEDATLGNVLPF